MIERLMKSEIRYGEPKYSKIDLEIREIKRALAKELDEDGLNLLESLSDAYLHQNSIQIEGAFVDGFCTAVDLILDVIRHSKE